MTLRPDDLRHTPPQRRADGLHVTLDDRALLACLGLPSAGPQLADDDDLGALVEGLSDVLGGLPPDGAAQEARLGVLPLARRGAAAVIPGDGEGRDSVTGWGPAQLRVGREPSDDMDDGGGHWRSFRAWRHTSQGWSDSAT